jgi:hypothetical protein
VASVRASERSEDECLSLWTRSELEKDIMRVRAAIRGIECRVSKLSEVELA